MFSFISQIERDYTLLLDRDIKEVSAATRCKKPCKYKKYKLIGQPRRTHRLEEKYFMLRSAADLTMVCQRFSDYNKVFIFGSLKVDTKRNLKREHSFWIFFIDFYQFVGRDRALDLPVDFLSGWVWRNPRSFPRILIHDHLGLFSVSSKAQIQKFFFYLNLLRIYIILELELQTFPCGLNLQDFLSI